MHVTKERDSYNLEGLISQNLYGQHHTEGHIRNAYEIRSCFHIRNAYESVHAYEYVHRNIFPVPTGALDDRSSLFNMVMILQDTTDVRL